MCATFGTNLFASYKCIGDPWLLSASPCMKGMKNLNGMNSGYSICANSGTSELPCAESKATGAW